MSGLAAIAQAAWQVRSGYSRVVVAVGTESMSNAPYDFTAESHARAAVKQGRLRDEIAAGSEADRRVEVNLEQDERIRPGTTARRLSSSARRSMERLRGHARKGRTAGQVAYVVNGTDSQADRSSTRRDIGVIVHVRPDFRFPGRSVAFLGFD